jgi:hypothetical protein
MSFVKLLLPRPPQNKNLRRRLLGAGQAVRLR